MNPREKEYINNTLTGLVDFTEKTVRNGTIKKSIKAIDELSVYTDKISVQWIEKKMVIKELNELKLQL